MRKKIKQLMNREEGFTLVELLAVIVILGIIVAIAVPSIGNVISRAEDNAEKAEQELVIDATRLFMVEGPETAPATNGGTLDVTVADLIGAGYLENNFETNTNETTGTTTLVAEDGSNSTLNPTDTVTVTAKTGTNGNITYTYEFTSVN